MDLFNNINTLQRSLDVSATRQRLITNNIANVDTPGYKTMDVSFEDILNTEKEKHSTNLSFQGKINDSRHFVIGNSGNSDSQPKVITQNNTSMLINENNVDIDYQMTLLAENNIWFNGLTEITNKEFSMLRYVITEGRG
ncbi:MAG: flagellar basal body rod protein FlgB [Vulcanibacillus sp.]